MKWVTIKKAAEQTGYYEAIIRQYIADGTWRRGIVWRTWRDGIVRISIGGYDAWVEGRVPRLLDKARATISAFRARPKWADLDEIDRIYAQARAITISTGVAHEVDHVIPLNHPAVCGLHVHANLRVITGAENRRKWNRWSDAMVSDQE